MNPDQKNRLFELFTAHAGDSLTPEEHAELQETLRRDAEARRLWFVHQDVEMGLRAHLAAEPVMPAKATVATPHPSFWRQWRPLTALAAGIVFGMFCTSVVYGFVVQRTGEVKRMPLPVFDAGLEGLKPLDTGLPHGADEWGVRSARIVSAENGVRPLKGQRMLRMEPILLSEQDENLYSHAYQVLDLRSLPRNAASGTVEAQVTASFCASQSGGKARYLIRAVALNEPPGTAPAAFWSKAEDAGVVSLTQRFETEAGDSGWHTFSAKAPLPHGAQSLVIMLSAISPKDETSEAAARYIDDVQVTLLTTSTSLR